MHPHRLSGAYRWTSRSDRDDQSPFALSSKVSPSGLRADRTTSFGPLAIRWPSQRLGEPAHHELATGRSPAPRSMGRAARGEGSQIGPVAGAELRALVVYVLSTSRFNPESFMDRLEHSGSVGFP